MSSKRMYNTASARMVSISRELLVMRIYPYICERNYSIYDYAMHYEDLSGGVETLQASREVRISHVSDSRFG